MGEFVLELLSTNSTLEESIMERTASAGFEGIAQMLLEQKKLMDALEAENRELRRQLTDLRRGIGIAVVIEGKTIQLATDQGQSIANGQSQAALQSLQSLQNSQTALSASGPQTIVNGGYNQSPGQTGRQQSVNLNSEKRDNSNTRSQLADSFVL